MQCKHPARRQPPCSELGGADGPLRLYLPFLGTGEWASVTPLPPARSELLQFCVSRGCCPVPRLSCTGIHDRFHTHTKENVGCFSSSIHSIYFT